MRCVLPVGFWLWTALYAYGAEPVTIPNAEQFDVRSASGREYRIFVAAPKSMPPAAGYPAIYLSDGNGNFPLLAAAVRRLSMNDASAVVVGIGYPSDDSKVHGERRTFDLTPKTSEESLKTQSKKGPASAAQTGGNDEFLAFIDGELKPLIEKKHAIDRKRQTLFGHSLGGLFALHVLFAKPDSFQTYLVSSPSIWWNDRSVLAEEKAFTEKYTGQSVAARVFISVGEWEEAPGPKVSKPRAEMLRDLRMVSNARELAARLSKSPVMGMTVEFREFKEEDHGSVVLPAASRGVRFALDPP